MSPLGMEEEHTQGLSLFERRRRLLPQLLSLAQLSRELAKGDQKSHDHLKRVGRTGEKMLEVTTKS